jgi:hypothetical protein
MAVAVRNRVYLLLALALAAFIVVGFTPTYYLRSLFHAPPITLLIHAHAIVFTAWVVLFVIQVTLISKQNYRTHMQLGIVGMVVAALIVVLGIAASFASARVNGPRPLGMTPAQFTFMPVSSILLYAGFVLAAFLLRKRAALHKRLMVLAMIAVLGPPGARLIRLAGLGADFLAIQTTVTAVFVIAALATDWVRHRSLHAVYALGGTLLVLSWPVRVWFAHTPLWESVGRWMGGAG